MNYKKDFEIFILIKPKDNSIFEEIQKTVLLEDNAFWKDGSKDVISINKEIVLVISQDDEMIRLAYRTPDNTFNDSIVLYPNDFKEFWENPESFFPELDEEEKSFFSNLSYGHNLELEILSLYTMRTGLSVQRAKQSRLFNSQSNRKKMAKEACEKQKHFYSLLQQKIEERKALL